MLTLDSLVTEGVREELTELDAHLVGQRRQSLESLINAWRRYGEILARGESIHLDDYLAMLFARDAISDLLQRATPPTELLLRALIEHYDSLFLLGTTRDGDGVLAAAVKSRRSGWWWSRVPVNLAR